MKKVYDNRYGNCQQGPEKRWIYKTHDSMTKILKNDTITAARRLISIVN
jgi:hypothetical protein